MSLYKGNTLISGHQVLYSTTGNNTDGAMTQAATTTQLNLKANDADVVHKTGNETIRGEKIFANTLIEKTTGTSYGSYVDFVQEINNKRRGTIRTAYNSDGSYSIMLGSNGPDASAPEGIKVTRNSSSIWATAPASDAIDSIVTTVNKSKSTNGYFKLGNGLIINWGTYGTGSGSATITYSMPYTSAPKIFAGNNYNSTGAFPGFTNVKTTSCTIYKNSGISGWWFAIGY